MASSEKTYLVQLWKNKLGNIAKGVMRSLPAALQNGQSIGGILRAVWNLGRCPGDERVAQIFYRANTGIPSWKLGRCLEPCEWRTVGAQKLEFPCGTLSAVWNFGRWAGSGAQIVYRA